MVIAITSNFTRISERKQNRAVTWDTDITRETCTGDYVMSIVKKALVSTSFMKDKYALSPTLSNKAKQLLALGYEIFVLTGRSGFTPEVDLCWFQVVKKVLIVPGRYGNYEPAIEEAMAHVYNIDLYSPEKRFENWDELFDYAEKNGWYVGRSRQDLEHGLIDSKKEG
jgi:hypothetical protein